MSAKRVISSLASLKLAVLVILALAIACSTATVLESLYDIPTARYWVYRAWWFRGILGVLGVNILFVMVDRWPWKKKHTPFLLAHVGILMLLFGSWMTDKAGLDGSLRVSEGESTSAVEIEEPILVVTEGTQVKTIPVRWTPPEAKFKPMSLKDYGLPYDLRLAEFVTHADPIYDFLPRSPQMELPPDSKPRPALKIQVTGGPMRITQDFWLWTGDQSTQGFQAGPAWFELKDVNSSPIASPERGPKIVFKVEKGRLAYRALSSSGEVVQGGFRFADIAAQGASNEIDPHWNGVKIAVTQFVPDAWVNTTYKVSRVQHGDLAPPSAVKVVATQGSQSTDVWLGIGSRALLSVDGHDLELGYFYKRLMLPFSVKLNRFTVDRYQGTNNPAEYSSNVTVTGDHEVSQVISMNEPLEYKGITLYQASYEEASPRPVTSILAVNRDPGRRWKYAGSLLIVFGSIVLFGAKYRVKRAQKKSAASQVGSGVAENAKNTPKDSEVLA